MILKSGASMSPADDYVRMRIIRGRISVVGCCNDPRNELRALAVSIVAAFAAKGINLTLNAILPEFRRMDEALALMRNPSWLDSEFVILDLLNVLELLKTKLA
jgi:hypothetical protein